MDRETIKKEIKELINEGNEKVLPTKKDNRIAGARDTVDSGLYCNWYLKCLSLLKSILKNEDVILVKFQTYEKHYYSNAYEAINALDALIQSIDKGYIKIQEYDDEPAEIKLSRIFNRFHKVARQLRNRHQERTTLNIEDEYDVQDLIHSLLYLYFDDIRAEEWTPSYAGKSSRMDFLLKNEKIVIEIKKSRKSLTEKELGDQLIVDVERYQSHPDCEKLICFVYDPEAWVGNPQGLINDLNKRHEGFLNVIIEPN